jgi:UDP-N-acetylmuramate dehydrogenase
LQVGGPVAEVIYFDPNIDDSNELSNLPTDVQILGRGTNVVIGDGGISSPVLKVASRDIKYESTESYVEISAGCRLDELVFLFARSGVTGIEGLSGIPGTVGGAIVQNAGAYLEDTIGSRIVDVKVFDLDSRLVRLIPQDKCEFKYRSSCFKLAKQLIVLSARLKLDTGSSREISTVHMERLQLQSPVVDCGDLVKHIWEIRHRKQHVLEDRMGDETAVLKSAGSIFKNLTSYPEWLNSMFQERVRQLIPVEGDAARWRLFNEHSHAIVSTLIATSETKAGDRFAPGMRIGNLQLGEHSVNTYLNVGGARSSEILSLAKIQQEAVMQSYGVQIEMEVESIGSS